MEFKKAFKLWKSSDFKLKKFNLLFRTKTNMDPMANVSPKNPYMYYNIGIPEIIKLFKETYISKKILE